MPNSFFLRRQAGRETTGVRFGGYTVFKKISFFSTTFFALFMIWPSAFATQPLRFGPLVLTDGFQRFVDALPIPPRIQITKDSNPDLAITLGQITAQLHRDLPPTQEWGYNGTSPGPIIEVESGKTIRVHWRNQLPATHVLPLPTGLSMDVTKLPDVRAVTHLHGAAVSQPSITDSAHNNDGWPDLWTTNGQEQVAEYPNNQTARTLWYHDHAMGSTGRNVAAGLAGMYIIHDEYERSLNLPSGNYEIPLLIRSRGMNSDGSLFYSQDIGSEFYGNSVEVNGKLWPFLNVEPRKYRFRFLNASNARTYAMKLTDQNDQSDGPAFFQIGSDGGFLQDTAIINDPADANSPRLTLAPAERADVIIDFSKYAGHSFMLENNNLDPGDNEIALPEIMVINVGTTLSAPDKSTLPMHMKRIKRIDVKSAKLTRQIVFGQMTMPDGSAMLQLNGKDWMDPITEKPELGSTEIWELVDTLTDIHPFHIHLVTFQVLDRTPFDLTAFTTTGKINYTGPPELPAPNEMGWKDVVRVFPNYVTRIIMKFQPYSGYYVYHCHILEHEDMDMMRPFLVTAPH
jgi:spore coat protein A